MLRKICILGLALGLVIVSMAFVGCGIDDAPEPEEGEVVKDAEPEPEEEPEPEPESEPEEPDEEPESDKKPDETQLLSEEDYVKFFVDHIGRVFEKSDQLDGEEEIEALKALANEYISFIEEHEIPDHLEEVNTLYTNAMEVYAKGQDAEDDEVWDAFQKLMTAAEELDSIVDMSEYE